MPTTKKATRKPATKTTKKAAKPKKKAVKTAPKKAVKKPTKAAAKPKKAVKKPTRAAAAKPAAKAKPARKKATTQIKKGSAYECRVCGVRVIVDEVCGCVEEHVFICCHQPMRKKRKTRAA